MPERTLIAGNDGANALQGGAGSELIYGFDPNGPQGNANVIASTRVATGLSQPVFATAPAGDFARLFVVEKAGRIKIVDLETGATAPVPFLDLSGEVNAIGEQGLLGLAFHPGYATNGLFYVYLSNAAGGVEVRRYSVMPGDPNRADASAPQLVTAVAYPATTSNHRAGWIGFGPDDKLYVALGDGAADPTSAQRLNTPLGKILRLDVDGDDFPGDPARNYHVPADNPATISGIAGNASPTGIFAAGLRNPFRDSFDRGLGAFFIADVGQSAFEEVNRGQAGANYGWPATEGAFDPAVFPAFTQPIHFYPHGAGASVTGGYVYRGQSEGLHGQYFFADFVTGKVWTLRFDGTSWVETDRTGQIVPNAPPDRIINPSSFAEDALGNLYILDFGGNVYRLAPQLASTDQADDLRGGGGDDMMFGGSGADALFGEAGRDVLYGGLGDDRLDGGGDGDTMAGGPGSDFYSVDSVSDLVHEALGEGSDGVVSTLAAYTLPAHVEISLFPDPRSPVWATGRAT